RAGKKGSPRKPSQPEARPKRSPDRTSPRPEPTARWRSAAPGRTRKAAERRREGPAGTGACGGKTTNPRQRGRWVAKGPGGPSCGPLSAGPPVGRGPILVSRHDTSAYLFVTRLE